MALRRPWPRPGPGALPPEQGGPPLTLVAESGGDAVLLARHREGRDDQDAACGGGRAVRGVQLREARRRADLCCGRRGYEGGPNFACGSGVLRGLQGQGWQLDDEHPDARGRRALLHAERGHLQAGRAARWPVPERRPGGGVHRRQRRGALRGRLPALLPGAAGPADARGARPDPRAPTPGQPRATAGAARRAVVHGPLLAGGRARRGPVPAPLRALAARLPRGLPAPRLPRDARQGTAAHRGVPREPQVRQHRQVLSARLVLADPRYVS
mmetsp:Transcript_33031/g.84187  ORF Transcript_33031/g.84187 Transcript_33031/m.84187 type:complete len:270 (-) Transcript_33031:14-823(-)